MAKAEKPEVEQATTAEGPRCLVCGEVIQYDEEKPDNGFKCKKQPGKHTVAAKTYYHLGAAHVQNGRDRRLFAPLIVLRPAYDVRDERTGRITQTQGLMVQFEQSGVYTTSDPEEQYFLDNKPGLLTGESGLKAWQKVYLTPQQQVQLAKDEVASLEERARQLREGNALLDQVKRARQAGAASA